MMGVVLWSNSSQRKAVIWCEDHGNLAYYTNDGVNLDETPELEAGDLVQFRVTQHDALRLADKISVLEEESHPALAASLRSSGPGAMAPAPQREAGSNVIPFRGKVQRRPSGQPLAALADA